MSLKGLAALAACFALATSAAEAGTCPAERAVYKIDNGDYSLRIEPDPHHHAFSNLGVAVTIGDKTWHFSLLEANGLPFDYLEPAGAPADETGASLLRVNFFADNLKRTGLPNTGKPAPRYIFSPELTQWAYNGADLIGHPRLFLPLEMWRLAGCR